MKFGKRHYRPQVDQMDCGVASLAMVFGYYGSYYSLAHLRELTKTTMDGTTALGLVKVAEEIGFETRAIKADMTLFDLPDLTFPFVAHVLKEGKLLHYYVVTGQDKDSIHIADPDPGVKLTKLPRERFAEEWTGVTLFMAPSPDYKPHKDQKNGLLSFIPILVKQRGLIANIVLATLLVTVINIVGSYYLQSIIDTYVPDQMRSTLGIISIGLVIVYILQQILSYAQEYLLLVLGQRLSIDVILSYIKHVFHLPMSFFATRRTGEIVSRFTDANSIIDALASTILSIFLDVSTVVIISLVLFSQNTEICYLDKKDGWEKVKDIREGSIGSIWKKGNKYYYFNNLGIFNSIDNTVYKISDKETLNYLLSKADDETDDIKSEGLTAINTDYIEELIKNEKLIVVSGEKKMTITIKYKTDIVDKIFKYSIRIFLVVYFIFIIFKNFFTNF